MNAKDIISKYSAEFPEPPKLTPNDDSVDGPLLAKSALAEDVYFGHATKELI